VRVAGYIMPGDGAIAVACEHPAAGFWADFVEKYPDDTSITVTSASRGHELDHRPGHDKVYLKGVDVAALHDRFLAERRPKAPVVVTAGEFVRVFEQAYADEIAWRKDRGVTAGEVARVAVEMQAEDASRSQTAGG
jgi:hypothetical protein